MMTGWYAKRTPDRSAKVVIAVTLLALLLVAAVPMALLAGVVMRPGAARREHLHRALGLSARDLRRRCEGNDAEALFWAASRLARGRSSAGS
jgi:hypothetical protein